MSGLGCWKMRDACSKASLLTMIMTLTPNTGAADILLHPTEVCSCLCGVIVTKMADMLTSSHGALSLSVLHPHGCPSVPQTSQALSLLSPFAALPGGPPSSSLCSALHCLPTELSLSLPSLERTDLTVLSESSHSTYFLTQCPVLFPCSLYYNL